ncbi:MAG: PepSY domain-containing protein, partial [Phycisphaerae bacterium]|nr:PepSY domain-containing protein [Phycisphaerae bacterium]
RLPAARDAREVAHCMEPRSAARPLLVIVILALVAILTLLLWNLAPMVGARSFRASQPKVTRRGVTSAVSLGNAHALAQERAATWTADAYLVRAEAAWYLTPGQAEMTTPPVAWAFSYFSPAAQSLAGVVIDDETVLWVPPFEIPMVPTPLGEGLPPYGIDTAWLSFRAAGGETFVREYPEAQVTFRLQQSEGRPVWTVSAFAEGEFLDVKLDAVSGAVLTPGM